MLSHHYKIFQKVFWQEQVGRAAFRVLQWWRLRLLPVLVLFSEVGEFCCSCVWGRSDSTLLNLVSAQKIEVECFSETLVTIN